MLLEAWIKLPLHRAKSSPEFLNSSLSLGEAFRHLTCDLAVNKMAHPASLKLTQHSSCMPPPSSVQCFMEMAAS